MFEHILLRGQCISLECVDEMIGNFKEILTLDNSNALVKLLWLNREIQLIVLLLIFIILINTYKKWFKMRIMNQYVKFEDLYQLIF